MWIAFWIIISLLILLLILCFIEWLFLLKLNRKIKKEVVKLDVMLCNINDMLHSLVIVLTRRDYNCEKLNTLIFNKNLYQEASMTTKKEYLDNLYKAKTLVDQIVDASLLDDEKFISIKSNLDDSFDDYGFFVNNYNKIIGVYNRHLKLIFGKIVKLIFRYKKRSTL